MKIRFYRALAYLFLYLEDMFSNICNWFGGWAEYFELETNPKRKKKILERYKSLKKELAKKSEQ
ncbi:hypothetical protein M0R19_05555 [Candidatus Pacearchaeota archaeon]|jgi:hypothetical protein|nr:hypothetical protein [Candidatus Pacearchaeota archaeon]